MSTPDEAMLSDAERAALAGLESKAEADDPRLAAQLRGRQRARRTPTAPRLAARVSLSWWGPVIAGIGLAIAIAALSVSVPAAMLGAVVFVVGLAMSSVLLRSKLSDTEATRADREHTGQEHGEGPFTNV